MNRSTRTAVAAAAMLILGMLTAMSGGAAAQSESVDQSVGVAKLAIGPIHGCALLTNGKAACWGGNRSGELGDGTTDDSNLPVPVKGINGVGELSGIRQISAGGGHTCALLRNSRVACWGSNNSGQLGNGAVESSSVPVAVVDDRGRPIRQVREIVTGAAHTCALFRNTSVQCWGLNADGELGIGSVDNTMSPTPVLGADGTGQLQGVRRLSAGARNTCAVMRNGRALCWGDNTWGQVGDGTLDDRLMPTAVVGVGGRGLLSSVRAMAPGTSTCGLLGNGQVACWGSNLRGALGSDRIDDSAVPIKVKGIDGRGKLSQGKAILGGGLANCAQLAGGRMACWGWNFWGQLGNGANDDSAVPVAVESIGGGGQLTGARQVDHGTFHGCVRTADGEAACWGWGFWGQLGNGANDDSPFPTPIASPGAASISGSAATVTGASSMRAAIDGLDPATAELVSQYLAG